MECRACFFYIRQVGVHSSSDVDSLALMSDLTGSKPRRLSLSLRLFLLLVIGSTTLCRVLPISANRLSINVLMAATRVCEPFNYLLRSSTIFCQSKWVGFHPTLLPCLRVCDVLLVVVTLFHSRGPFIPRSLSVAFRLS